MSGMCGLNDSPGIIARQKKLLKQEIKRQITGHPIIITEEGTVKTSQDWSYEISG